MKRNLRILFILLFSCIYSASHAQNAVVTDSIKVDGNCDMCKKRIEDAAYTKGVKRADWNKQTHMLVVVYKPAKTDMKKVAAQVAKAGHSSEKAEATREDYERLPDCCHYKTNTCEH